MSTNKQEVPKIRFDGFYNNWENTIVDNLVNEKIIDQPMDGNHGAIHPTSEDYRETGIPFVMANDIENGKLNLKEARKISYGLAESLRKGFSIEGDVLLTHKATIGETAIVPKLNVPYIVLTPQVTYYRVLDEFKLDRHFLKSTFQTPSFKNELLTIGTGATRLYIGITDQRSIKISLTTIEEQTQIGNFFQQLDKLIELQTHAVESAETYKKAMLQKIFPQQGVKVPRVRFTGFSGGWEVIALGKLVDITTGKLDANAMTKDGEYDFYTSGIQKYKINVPAFEGPAITIAGNGATVGYMHYADNLFNAYQRTYVLTGFRADRSFLFPMISRELPKKIHLEARTGSIPYIVMDMLTELNLFLPCEEEQTQIGNFFQKLDQNIESEKKKLEKYQAMKKAMLQRMFI